MVLIILKSDIWLLVATVCLCIVRHMIAIILAHIFKQIVVIINFLILCYLLLLLLMVLVVVDEGRALRLFSIIMVLHDECINSISKFKLIIKSNLCLFQIHLFLLS